MKTKLLGLFMVVFVGLQISAQQQPNILYIMSDDHASAAISAYGGRYAKVAPTPNIDRIANEGMRMNNVMCTNAICTPSRAVILTGQYSHTNGVYTLKDDLDNSQGNMAKEMKKAGYTTAMIGKWHLHKEPTGFDYYNVLPNQGRYHDPLLKEKGKKWQDHKKGGEVFKGYATDVIADQTIKWLENRDKSKPFFVMSHHKAPHGLWEYAKRHKDLFKDVKIPEPETLYNRENHGPHQHHRYGSSISPRWEKRNMLAQVTSDKWPTGKIDTTGMSPKEKISAAYQKYLKDYLKTVAAIDENVGKVLDYLDANGLTENTIVVYTSDQGQFLGEHDYFDKRWMYEESLKMPFLIRYPKQIKAGTVNNDMVMNVDFAPTLLDFAGQNKPDFMEGESFKDNLIGGQAKLIRKEVYYRYWMHMSAHFNPAHYGIRTDKYKLIFFYGLPLGKTGAEKQTTAPYWELYDIENDPSELNNIYHNKKYKEVIKALKYRLNKLKEKVGDTDEAYPELVELKKKYWNE